MRATATLLAALALLVGHAPAQAETTKTTETTTHQATAQLDENDPGWACWAMGDRRCSVLPLVHRSTGPAVCTTDADCEAWDARRLVRGTVDAA